MEHEIQTANTPNIQPHVTAAVIDLGLRYRHRLAHAL